jgi:uncharacterized membrane protein
MKWVIGVLALLLSVFGAVPIGIAMAAGASAPAVAEQIRLDPCSAYTRTVAEVTTRATGSFHVPKWGTPRHQSLTSPALAIPAGVKALYLAAGAR